LRGAAGDEAIFAPQIYCDGLL